MITAMLRPLCVARALALMATFASCGYRTLGPRGQLGQMGVTSVCIMPFAEAGPINMTGPLTDELGQALMAEGFVIEPNAKLADALLTGQIELRNSPGSTLQSMQLYTVDLSVSAALWGDGHTPLWQEAISLQEDFLPTDPATDTEPLVTEGRRRVTLLRLTERAAHILARSMSLYGTSGPAPLPKIPRDDGAGSPPMPHGPMPIAP